MQLLHGGLHCTLKMYNFGRNEESTSIVSYFDYDCKNYYVSFNMSVIKIPICIIKCSEMTSSRGII